MMRHGLQNVPGWSADANYPLQGQGENQQSE